jgi:hypothetical protein
MGVLWALSGYGAEEEILDTSGLRGRRRRES